MHTSELMRGNIVYYQGERWYVSTITETGVTLWAPDRPVKTPMSGYSGIPLTPDILVKAGWEKTYYPEIYQFKHSGGSSRRFLYSIDLQELEITVQGYCALTIKIAHLHTLQNFFAITGSPLKIEL